MIKILFVCHGNICRSPMAEFVMKEMVRRAGLENEFYIESAATSTEEIWNGVGNPVYPPAQKMLARHGISCGDKRARQMKAGDYGRFDLIIGMDDRNIRNMQRICGNDIDGKIWKLMTFAGAGEIAESGGNLQGDSAAAVHEIPGRPALSQLKKLEDRLEKIPAPDVADPWYTGDFQQTWEDVNAGCAGLLRLLAGIEVTRLD